MAAHDSQAIEKRKIPRINFGGKFALATIPDTGSITLGEVQNVSKSGLRVIFSQHFGSPLVTSKPIIFEILEDHFRLQGEGEIAWISPDGDKAGIKFSQLNEENIRSLDDFLRRRG